MILFDALANIAATGYGGFSKNFILELLSLGIDVRTKLRESDWADVQIFAGQLFTGYIEHENTQALQAEKLVFFTMWEASVCPPEFVSTANELADLVIVPSEWNKQVFIANGMTVPIEVVPLGINSRDFPPLIRDRTDGRKPFTYLWQGFIHVRDRKGGNLVEQAFIDLINTEEIPRHDVRLIMKSVPFLIPAFGHNHPGLSHNQEAGLIRVHQTNMGQAELIEMMEESDCSIQPTSGEGFGLIALEHMATGLPTFAPYSTGMTEYLPKPKTFNDDESVYIPLETKSMSPLVQIPGQYDAGKIDRPYYDDIREKMKWAYHNRHLLPAIGKRGSEYAHKNYNYRVAAERLLDVLEQHFGYRTKRAAKTSQVDVTATPEFSNAQGGAV